MNYLQDAFIEKHKLTRQDNNFYVALNHLAQFLKITTLLFFKPGLTYLPLSEPSNFFETDIAFAHVRIEEMLSPFTNRPPQKPKR